MKGFFKWLSEPYYSLIDAVWLGVVAIAIHESQYLAAGIAAVIGIGLSEAIVCLSNRKGGAA